MILLLLHLKLMWIMTMRGNGYTLYRKSQNCSKFDLWTTYLANLFHTLTSWHLQWSGSYFLKKIDSSICQVLFFNWVHNENAIYLLKCLAWHLFMPQQTWIDFRTNAAFFTLSLARRRRIKDLFRTSWSHKMHASNVGTSNYQWSDRNFTHRPVLLSI